MSKLNHGLPSHIVDKILTTPISLTNMLDKIVWKFSSDGKFSIKTVT